jgi:hypothetical protein
MKKNMGTTDRVIRILIAVVFAALYFADIATGTLGIVVLVVSGIFLVTGLTGFCPLYYPFGLHSTKKIEKAG